MQMLIDNKKKQIFVIYENGYLQNSFIRKINQIPLPKTIIIIRTILNLPTFAQNMKNKIKKVHIEAQKDDNFIYIIKCLCLKIISITSKILYKFE